MFSIKEWIWFPVLQISCTSRLIADSWVLIRVSVVCRNVRRRAGSLSKTPERIKVKKARNVLLLVDLLKICLKDPQRSP